MIKILEAIKECFANDNQDRLIEGLYADQYNDPDDRMRISKTYKQRFTVPQETPDTHPWKYDPLNPPPGWKYDPYYEIWINFNRNNNDA